jgi:hypothetical protein
MMDFGKWYTDYGIVYSMQSTPLFFETLQPRSQRLLGMAREPRKTLVKYAEISKILEDLSHAQ